MSSASLTAPSENQNHFSWNKIADTFIYCQTGSVFPFRGWVPQSGTPTSGNETRNFWQVIQTAEKQ
jgi:hypothetical protein